MCKHLRGPSVVMIDTCQWHSQGKCQKIHVATSIVVFFLLSIVVLSYLIRVILTIVVLSSLMRVTLTIVVSLVCILAVMEILQMKVQAQIAAQQQATKS